MSKINTYPKKEGDSGVILEISPPVIKKYDPIDAKTNPTIFNLFNFSLKNIIEKIAIITGETKQSYKAGIEGPINSTAEYKKKR